MSFSPVRSSAARPSPASRSASPARAPSHSELGSRISSQVQSAVKGGAPSSTSSLHSQIRSSINSDRFEPSSKPAPVNLSGGIPPASPRPTSSAQPPTSPAPTSGTPPTSGTTAPSGELDSGPGDSAEVDGWIKQAETKMGRDFTAEEEEAIRVVAYYESRNTPGASNDFDANAQSGNPSQGLMQVTQSNFQNYNPGGNIFDPVDSIIAAVRYSDERYGGIDKSKGYVDYKNGGATDPYGGWNGGYTWY
jgi:hypothetical protein